MFTVFFLSEVYPSSISDHSRINAVWKIGILKDNTKFIESRSFKHFDENAFKSDLQYANWPSTESVNNANVSWAQVKNVFLNSIDKHTPCRTIKVQ